MIRLRNKTTSEELLLDGANFSYTNQIGDITDLTKTNASFSPSFNIPQTFNNIGVMSGLGLIASTSDIPYISTLWDLYIDDIAVVRDAELIISETSNGRYSAHLKQGVVSFFKDIQADTISESIDLSELEHLNSTFEVTNSWTANKPYKYIVADYNNVQLSKINDTTNLSKAGIHPSLNVKWLLDKIFETYGWTYNLAPDISDLWLTYPTALNYDESSLLNVLNARLSQSTEQTYRKYITFENETLDPNYFEIEGDGFKALISGEYKIHIDYYIEAYTIGGGDVPFNIFIEIDGVRNTYNPSISDIFDITQGQVIRLIVDTFIPSNTTVIKINGGNINIFETDVQQVSFVEAFIDFNVADFIKEITVRLCASYNAYVSNRHIEFITLSDRINAPKNNLSKYFVKRLKENYSISGYAKENVFTLNYHNDNIGRYADASFTLSNENVEKTREIFKSEFTASLNYTAKYMLSDGSTAVVPVIPMFDIKVNNNADTGDISIDYEPLDSRFYLIRNYTAQSNIYIEGIAYSNVPIATTSRVTLKYFIDVYWREIGRILNKPLVHYIEFNLFSFNMDAIKLDEVAEIMQEGSRYLVNRVEYKTGDLVKAELIKIR